MKLWKVFLKKGNQFNVSFLVLGSETETDGTILNNIANTGCVSGMFYRIERGRGESDGTNTQIVRADKFRIISMSVVEVIEPVVVDRVQVV